jgi:hypothetical protein
MKPETVIEYPAAGATYHRDEYGVYRYDTYPSGSVLEGEERRSALGSYPTLEEAQHNHPEATWTGGSGYREITIPEAPPAWFDPAAAGETWSDE